MRAILLIAPALLLAAPALAADPAPAPVATATPAAVAPPAKPKKLCRRTQETGSIVPRSTCHTAEEWRIVDAQNAESVDRFNDQASSSTHGRTN
ncbi:MAG: hypothetical protein KGN34_03830 [Sphingomonadales bacterium]|nr:hypothetical protein [Sphingomonadales bacterium]